MRPATASPAFVKYRHEEEILAAADDVEHVYLTRVLPDKLRLDLDYIERQWLLFDLKAFGQAALSLFTTPDK